MIETTTFDDLDMLAGDDLRAVFKQMTLECVVAALWGAPIALRGRLLRRLSRAESTRIEQAIAATEHLSFAAVREAQLHAVAVMCQMSRSGLIAFDAPEDMVA